MRRPVLSLLALSLLTVLLAPASAATASPTHTPGRCVDAPIRANRLSMRVGGELATGRYALPRKAPRTLLVYAHGYGHTTASWVKHFENADRHGVAAVGMDYRGLQVSPDSNGDGYPEARGFNVWKGSEDLIAAAKSFQRRCPSIRRIVMFSVSLGGNVAGIALARSAEMGSTPEDPLFDEWINVEGEVNLVESSTEARLLAPANEFAARVVEDIEEECGGPIEEVPQAYLDRTVVARVGDIAASGLRSAVVIHGLDDGLVPYNQAREIATLMAATGIPTDMVTIGRRSPRSERETTLTSYAAGQLDPDYTSPFAGHASEKSTTHIVMVTAFERLWSLLGGEDPGPYREFLVDGEAGTFPAKAS
jgi:hypothetical protein